MTKRQGVTAKDIADACNVSQATVSYVINQTQGKRVSEAKRQEILQKAKEMKYFPNRSAQNIRQQKSTAIGFLCNNYGEPRLGDVLRSVTQILNKHGYTLILLADYNNTNCEEILEYYYSNSISGVICAIFDMQTFDTTVLEENNIPFVFLNEDGVRCNHFAPKNYFEQAIRQCVQFCKDNNLQRIRYITRTIFGRRPINKYAPLKKAIEDIYPEADFERILCTVTQQTEDELWIPVKEYMDNHEFDIVITSNHRIGMVTQRYILSKNFELPQRPLHICLSSLPYLRTTYPSLSSLDIPLFEMGSYAAELIFSLVNDLPFEEKNFKCQLIHGDTTKL